MPSLQTVAVIGAGAWGTALATVAARAGRSVTLYARDADHAARIAVARENPRLPGIQLAADIAVTSDLAQAARAQIMLVVTPAQHLRSAMDALGPHLAPATPVIACAKGIEHGTHKFMTDVIAEAAAHAMPAILSGPSFADDVARGLPTAVTLAAKDDALAASLVQALGSPTFRPYHSTDVRGVEIGGAAKNVLAIAAGIVVGKELGASAQAALTTRGFAELSRFGRALGSAAFRPYHTIDVRGVEIGGAAKNVLAIAAGIVAGRGLGASAAAALTTRGFAELMRFGKAFGARSETLTGLSGLGDLILTCSTSQSRNFAAGLALGRGEPPPAGKLAEGISTAPVLVELAASHHVDMPVAAAVANILAGRLSIDAAIEGLLARPFKAE